MSWGLWGLHCPRHGNRLESLPALRQGGDTGAASYIPLSPLDSRLGGAGLSQVKSPAMTGALLSGTLCFSSD